MSNNMYFGTDGIRGVANSQITPTLAHSCGNALTIIKSGCRVVVGRDTRYSGTMLSLAIASGVMQGGGEVIDVGIMPTAGIAYLTRIYRADYGVVISASHNPPEYNGIKIFDGKGYKLSEDEESKVEQAMASSKSVDADKIGKYTFMHNATDSYLSHLVKDADDLSEMKILLDCSNGAAYEVAPRAFEMLGATVTAINVDCGGKNINVNAGALHADLLADKVKQGGFDLAFAYDGDSDRLIALDENGNVVDGDKILCILARSMKQTDKLKKMTVVGTSHTNLGIERSLNADGVKVLRADVGDKYVLEKMLATGAVLGGEQSGHIILLDYATTGDGILTSIVLAGVVRRSGKKLSQLADVQLLPQSNVNLIVKDKIRVLNNEGLSDLVESKRIQLGQEGRITVRASGTEPKLRIMVECLSQSQADSIADEIASFVKNLNF
ncbi:MAG: phosphoglucosamine mutase [Christensenellales bacterium]